MSRIRSIKPEWLDDEFLALASSDARVLSIALVLLADDYGNGRANKVLLAGRAFPGKNIETLAKALEELAKIRFVVLYESDGQQYFSIRNWAKHQRVDKPGKPQVPGPPPEPPGGPNGGLAKIREGLEKVPGSLAPDLEGSRRDSTGRERDASARGAPAPSPSNQQGEPRIGENPATAEPEPNEPEHERFSDFDQQTLFKREVEAVLGTVAVMHGKRVGGFNKVVRDTAAMQRKDPRELFLKALRTWLAKGFDDRSRSYPYACFESAWGELTSTAPQRASPDQRETVDSLRKQAQEAFAKGDLVRMKQLNARAAELQDAQANGGRRARA